LCGEKRRDFAAVAPPPHRCRETWDLMSRVMLSRDGKGEETNDPNCGSPSIRRPDAEPTNETFITRNVCLCRFPLRGSRACDRDRTAADARKGPVFALLSSPSTWNDDGLTRSASYMPGTRSKIVIRVWDTESGSRHIRECV